MTFNEKIMNIYRMEVGNSKLEYMMRDNVYDLQFLKEFETFLLGLPDIFQKIKGTKAAPMFSSIELLDKVAKCRSLLSL